MYVKGFRRGTGIRVSYTSYIDFEIVELNDVRIHGFKGSVG